MGGAERVARQHEAGRLTVRERIARLVDPGSFHETGALTGVPVYEGDRLVEIRPSNFVTGTARLDGRKVVLGGDDFTVRGGAADGTVGYKAGYAERMALEQRLPIVRLVDGTGGGGSVKSLETTRRTYVPANPAMEIMTELLLDRAGRRRGARSGRGARRGARGVLALLGHAEGHARSSSSRARPWCGAGSARTWTRRRSAARRSTRARAAPSTTRSRARTRRSRRSAASCPTYRLRCTSCRRCAPCDDPTDRRDEELLQIVPRSRRQPHDLRRILALVLDRASFFEIVAALRPLARDRPRAPRAAGRSA